MSHWYNKQGVLQPEGEGYPSVTTILKVRDLPGLDEWRLRVGPEEAHKRQQESSSLGTKVHQYLEAAVRIYTHLGHVFESHKYPLPPESEPYVNGFYAWLKKTEPTDCKPEVFLYSDLHEFAGTADLICKIDGEDWLIDFKTSKHIDAGYALQLVAYAEAYREMTGIVCRRGVLQLTPTLKRGYRFKEFDNPNDFGVFMAHKEIFDWLLSTRPGKKKGETQSALLEETLV